MATHTAAFRLAAASGGQLTPAQVPDVGDDDDAARAVDPGVGVNERSGPVEALYQAMLPFMKTHCVSLIFLGAL